MFLRHQDFVNVARKDGDGEHLEEARVGHNGSSFENHIAFFVGVIVFTPSLVHDASSFLHARHFGLEAWGNTTTYGISFVLAVTIGKLRLDEVDAVHILIETVVRQLEAHLGNQNDANGETYA